jgi:hypothetical protein
MQLGCYVGLKEQSVQVGQGSFSEEGSSEADGFGVPIQELEEGVMANIAGAILIQLEEILVFRTGDRPWYLLEEKRA